MIFDNVRMREYTTTTLHIGFNGNYSIGTKCMAARLPNDKVVLTFENESIILGKGWWLPGLEQPRYYNSICDEMAADIYAIEDALVIEHINRAILALEEGRGVPK